MRNYLLPVVMTALFGLVFCPTALLAQDTPTPNSDVVIERANQLKFLLDRLLSESNDSSIHDALYADGESGDPLLEEALRLKSSGEKLLADEEYLKAAVTLQAALDKVFAAIRVQENRDENTAASSAQLAEAISANDTFISAATRVISDEKAENAVDLLESAREARSNADASAAKGDLETALKELETSTHLAQQAIMTVRNGKVIERKP